MSSDRPLAAHGLRRDVELLVHHGILDEGRAELDELLADLERQSSRADATAVICIVGPTGAGKPTLLNALAGRTIASEGVDRPTTTAPVIYAPSDLDDGALRDFPEAEIVHYHPEADRAWSGHVLIDGPDVNSIRSAHRETVERLAALSDVLVLMLHRQAVAEEAVATFVDEFGPRRHVAVVVGRRDEMTDSTLAAVVQQVRQTAEHRWNIRPDAVFALSATQAKESPLREPGFLDLLEWLQHLLDKGVIQGVRRDNSRGAAALLRARCVRLRPRLDERLGRLEDALATAWADLAGQIGDAVGRAA